MIEKINKDNIHLQSSSSKILVEKINECIDQINNYTNQEERIYHLLLDDQNKERLFLYTASPIIDKYRKTLQDMINEINLITTESHSISVSFIGGTIDIKTN